MDMTELPSVRDDGGIEEAVTDALLQNGRVEAYDIQVKANDGTVTLEGYVPDQYMKRIAAYVAKGVSGVKTVENELRLLAYDERVHLERERRLKH